MKHPASFSAPWFLALLLYACSEEVIQSEPPSTAMLATGGTSSAGHAGVSSAGSSAGNALQAGASGQASGGESAGNGAGSPEQGGATLSGGTAGGESTAGKAGEAGAGEAGAAGALAGQGAEAGASGVGGAGQGGGAGGEAGAGENGGKSGEHPGCPENLPGPKLIALQAPNGTPYCIDQTEVTQGQYQDFLEKNKNDMSGQPPECAFDSNLIYVGFGCPKEYWTPKETPERAVMCADWCDAVAYCKWSGKHLCGKIGGGGIPTKGALELEGDGNKTSALNDPNVSQLYNACSQGGKHTYAYGDVYNPACPIEGANQNESQEECRSKISPFDQVLHLSDSVGEWELTEPFFTTGVPARGYLEYTDDEVEWNGRCNKVIFPSSGDRVGFRCCYDF